jgi:predicted phosphodiesterase
MNKETRILCMGDNHGNHSDPDTLDAILRFSKAFRPTVRIHLGDNWDLASLRKGVSKGEKEASGHDLMEDVDAGCDWVRKYAPTHFLMGNHEQRVRDMMHNTDSITRLESIKDIDRKMRKAIRQSGCKVIKDYNTTDNYIDIGPITFVHGRGSDPLRSAYRVNSGRGRAVVMGHYHRAEQMNLERLGGGCVWVNGCACDLDMQYAEITYSRLRWQHSFMAFIVKGENYIGRQAHRFNGKWIMPFST